MEVILMENVPTLGSIGEVVKVRAGYARNYLLPNKLGVLASSSSKKQLAHQQRMIEAKRQKQREADEALAQRLEKVELRVARKVGEQGKLYGSVTVEDVESAFKDQDMVVDRRCIQLSQTIKALGAFDIKVKLSKDVMVELKLEVVAEES